MPAPPETLNELFLERQNQLDQERQDVTELITHLKTQEIIDEPESNYKYFEGIVAIKSMWHEVNSKIKKSTTERIYGGKKAAYERLVGFYDEHHKIRNKKQATAKIILTTEDRPLGKKRSNKNTQVRYSKLTNKAEWGIVDDMFYLQYITAKKPRAFLIKDKIFSQTFAETFDKVWKESKKI